jgi:TIR domain
VANETYDVFVSYPRADWRHAAEIDSVLPGNGLRSFFDRCNLAPGIPWVRALEQAIGAAKAVIVLIGTSWAPQHSAIRTRTCLGPSKPRFGLSDRRQIPPQGQRRRPQAC